MLRTAFLSPVGVPATLQQISPVNGTFLCDHPRCIRPQYIYGPLTNKRDYLDWFFDRVVHDIELVPIPLHGDQLVTLTHAEDVASMLASVIGNENAVNQVRGSRSTSATVFRIVKYFLMAVAASTCISALIYSFSPSAGVQLRFRPIHQLQRALLRGRQGMKPCAVAYQAKIVLRMLPERKCWQVVDHHVPLSHANAKANLYPTEAGSTIVLCSIFQVQCPQLCRESCLPISLRNPIGQLHSYVAVGIFLQVAQPTVNKMAFYYDPVDYDLQKGWFPFRNNHFFVNSEKVRGHGSLACVTICGSSCSSNTVKSCWHVHGLITLTH